MPEITPRIEAVTVLRRNRLAIGWRGGGEDQVNLSDWIATGGDILAPLKEARVFGLARPGRHGAAVVWDDHDLAIDAVHLEQLANEQNAGAEVGAGRGLHERA